ncbi:MAG TPA: carbohydrate kinase family protein [Candidatus Paceibacterota bacterium]|nr:carbohydrate kinase family protein [Candidatus Paceibacterota bacterium]
MFSKQIDFIAVGDITTDAFIRLKDAHVNCSINNTTCELCVKFGDKIPYESVDIVPAVGNSANAAVSASRLGLSSYLIANIGGDQNGKECLETLSKDKVKTKYVTVHKKMITNYHYVLWYGDERTIMVKHQEYPYALPSIDEPRYLYLSSLGGNSYEYHMEIARYLEKHPKVKLVFQPGTFQMKLGFEKLKPLYEKSEIFFCNVEEAQRILGTEEKDIKTLLTNMRAKGPKTVVITDGPKGAYAFDGAQALFMPPYPDTKPALERTGAGDAFASTFTCALILGKSLEEALRWAPINSMSVVQDIGAQRGLLTQKQLLEYLAKAPPEYKPVAL